MKWLARLLSAASRRGAGWVDRSGWGWASTVGRSLAGIPVDERRALSLTAAFAAINVISTDVASLPLRLYRRRPDGGRDEVRDHPIAELLAVSPNGETTAMRWQQAWMGHALAWGNGYAEIETDKGGRPIGLHLLSPDPLITRAERRPQDKRLFYRVGTDTLPPYKVLHLAGLGFDGLTGYSPIRLAREAIGLGLAAEAFGAAFFGNGTSPKGVLKTEQKLSQTAVDHLRDSWNEKHRGVENAGKPAILEQGLEWQSLSIPPEDAQFLQTRQFQVVEIARLYRVPPHKIGDYSQSHLANIEASNLDYVITVLAPWCEQMEQVLNFRLLTADERAKGLYVEHILTALLRGDMKARSHFYTQLRDLGVLSPNDICKLENLNPIGPDGDIRLVPLNMISLEQAGKAPAAGPGPAVPGQNG